MTGDRPGPGEEAPSRFRRLYGAGPWHLIVTMACLALVGLSVAAWLDQSGPSSAAPNGGGGAMAGMDMASPGAGRTAVASAGDCSAHACPIPSPATNELAVAGQLGSALAALWLEPADRELRGRL